MIVLYSSIFFVNKMPILYFNESFYSIRGLCECDAIAQAQCGQMKASFHWSVVLQYLLLAWAAPLTSAGILLHTNSTKHQPAFLSVYKFHAC